MRGEIVDLGQQRLRRALPFVASGEQPGGAVGELLRVRMNLEAGHADSVLDLASDRIAVIP